MASRIRLRNIQRVDHNHFHGWLVRLKRAGQNHERYISDRLDAKAALSCAVRWRDEMTASLPPPRKFKRRDVRNTTGVIGVHFSTQHRGKGTRYCATWIDAFGRPHKRSFSVAKYGRQAARALAIRARRDALAEQLRPRDAAPKSLMEGRYRSPAHLR